MTEERLAELERAAQGCVWRGHPEWTQSLTAGELLELCRAARYGHEDGQRAPTLVTYRDDGSLVVHDGDGQRVLPAGVDLLALGDWNE